MCVCKLTMRMVLGFVVGSHSYIRRSEASLGLEKRLFCWVPSKKEGFARRTLREDVSSKAKLVPSSIGDGGRPENI